MPTTLDDADSHSIASHHIHARYRTVCDGVTIHAKDVTPVHARTMHVEHEHCAASDLITAGLTDIATLICSADVARKLVGELQAALAEHDAAAHKGAA